MFETDLYTYDQIENYAMELAAMSWDKRDRFGEWADAFASGEGALDSFIAEAGFGSEEADALREVYAASWDLLRDRQFDDEEGQLTFGFDGS